MITNFIYEDHAEEVKKWGEKHKFPLPSQSCLSDIGFIVDDTAVGFLYTTNSSIGWVEWVFSNPAKSSEERREALDSLMAHLSSMAEALSIQVLISASATFAYCGVLERNGFKKTDSNMTHYIKVIEG